MLIIVFIVFIAVMVSVYGAWLWLNQRHNRRKQRDLKQTLDNPGRHL